MEEKLEKPDPFKKLSQEHSRSLQIAEQLASIAETDNENQLIEGIDLLKKYNETELEAHLQHEERTIFMVLIHSHQKCAELCIELGREHGALRTYVEEITLDTAKKDLAGFASLLKSHSLKEEQELFPIAKSLFNKEQLEQVLNFEPWEPLH